MRCGKMWCDREEDYAKSIDFKEENGYIITIGSTGREGRQGTEPRSGSVMDLSWVYGDADRPLHSHI